MDLLFSVALFAASSAAKPSSGSSSTFFIFLALLVVVFWFAIIRPQKSRQRAQQQAMSQIGPGDEVVTVGGLVGTVVETHDDRVVLLVAPGIVPHGGGASQPVEMTFLRQAISRKLSSVAEVEGDPDDPDEPDGDPDSSGSPDSGQ